MIAFVQPFSLGEGTGGARILRALLADAPQPVISISAAPSPLRPHDICPEIHLPLRPYFGRLEGTRLARYLAYFNLVYEDRFKEGLRKIFRERGVTAVHGIPHGLHFWYAFQVAREMNLPYILNVHDDMNYNLNGNPLLGRAMKGLSTVWRDADHRFVISLQMGEEYQRRYGAMPFEIMTDGLTEETIFPPRPAAEGRMRLYFMGALHLTYDRNFSTAVRALSMYKERHPGTEVAFISRGSRIGHTAPGVIIENHPFAPESVVSGDFAGVDLLYLPLPFEDRYAVFSRYSLSTKMVTYLGSGVPILYHGPRDAAAAKTLLEHDAAVIVDSPEPEALYEGMRAAQVARTRLVENALELGRRHFWLESNRERFWKTIHSLVNEGMAAA